MADKIDWKGLIKYYGKTHMSKGYNLKTMADQLVPVYPAAEAAQAAALCSIADSLEKIAADLNKIAEPDGALRVYVKEG